MILYGTQHSVLHETISAFLLNLILRLDLLLLAPKYVIT